MINVDSIIHIESARAGSSAQRAPELLSAAQAAALLGVKRASLYAYVSRGLIRTVGSSRSGGHLYHRDDLTHLLLRRRARSGHAGAAASAMHWGEPVLDSAITAILPAGPHYRGRSAVELATTGAGFERVAEWLWSTSERPWRSAPTGRLPRVAPGLPRLVTVVGLATSAALARAAKPGPAESPLAELDRARALIVRLAENLGAHVPFRGTIAETAARSLGLRPTGAVQRAIDAALVLLADHELNASSFACRVAASTGAPLEACLCAGLAALVGPRHGTASHDVVRLLDELRDPARAHVELARRARRGDALPGFGHTLYRDGDPRCAPLLALAEPFARRRRWWKVVLAVLRYAGRRGERPNVDFGLAVLSRALGAPADAPSLLFALGRTAGWVAHALEQRTAGFILRPRARYTGPLPGS